MYVAQSRDLKSGYAQLSKRNAAASASVMGGGDLTTDEVFRYAVPTMPIPKRVPPAREKLSAASSLSLSSAALLAGAKHAGHSYHPTHNTATHSMLADGGAAASAAAAAATPTHGRSPPRETEKESDAGVGAPGTTTGGAGTTAAAGGVSDKAARRLGQLRLPLLRDLMLPEAKFVDPAAGGRTGGKAGASVIPTATASAVTAGAGIGGASQVVKVNAAGDDVVDEAAQLRGRTGEEAIAFFARHGSNTTVKFVYLNRAVNRGAGAPTSAASDTASNAGGEAGAVVAAGGVTDRGGDQIQYTAEGQQLVLPRYVEFRPYDLVAVSRKELDPEYFTISATGIVHIKPDEPSEFISLAEWMHQSTAFNTLRSIGFFKHYIEAKCFRLWRSNVRYRKYREKKLQLQLL